MTPSQSERDRQNHGHDTLTDVPLYLSSPLSASQAFARFLDMAEAY